MHNTQLGKSGKNRVYYQAGFGTRGGSQGRQTNSNRETKSKVKKQAWFKKHKGKAMVRNKALERDLGYNELATRQDTEGEYIRD